MQGQWLPPREPCVENTTSRNNIRCSSSCQPALITQTSQRNATHSSGLCLREESASLPRAVVQPGSTFITKRNSGHHNRATWPDFPDALKFWKWKSPTCPPGGPTAERWAIRGLRFLGPEEAVGAGLGLSITWPCLVGGKLGPPGQEGPVCRGPHRPTEREPAAAAWGCHAGRTEEAREGCCRCQ